MGKSRVSPIKHTTIPRLELTAATVAVKVAALVIEELKINDLHTCYWTDSKIVLGYIFNDMKRYKVYVANRVQVIRSYTKKEQWRYVDTEENPSDCASRGISPRETRKKDVWLHGPAFLRNFENSWKEAVPEIAVDDGDPEVKTVKLVNAITIGKSVLLEHLEKRISDWYRMKRVMAWVLRFAKRCRKLEGYGESDLAVSELQSAEQIIIKLVQVRSLEKEMKVLRSGKGEKLESLRKLDPFIDRKDGLLKVGGRLGNASEDTAFRFPVIIPKGTVIGRVLVEWHHAGCSLATSIS